MDILEWPHPLLATNCEIVCDFDETLHSLLDGMWSKLDEMQAYGLAANQVGANCSLFIMNKKDGSRLEIINPIMVGWAGGPANLYEGCLSEPTHSKFAIVTDRTAVVELEYQDRHGCSYREIFTGSDSVCVQHEYDHIQGRYFLDQPLTSISCG